MSRPKNIASVAKERLINPLATTREVEQATGIDHTTVSRIDKQLQQFATKNQDIISITDTDKVAIELAQKIIIQSLEKHVELSEASGGLSLQEALQASGLAKESTARFTLFKGSATDSEGGLLGYDILNDLQSGKLGREDAYSLLQKSKE